MKIRIVGAKYDKRSPEFDGHVWAQAEIEDAPFARPVHVTLSLYTADDASDRKDRFDWYAGTIEPDPTPRGTMRWQYRYPSGQAYPGLHATIIEAAQPAILYAADIFARDVHESAKAKA